MTENGRPRALRHSHNFGVLTPHLDGNRYWKFRKFSHSHEGGDREWHTHELEIQTGGAVVKGQQS